MMKPGQFGALVIGAILSIGLSAEGVSFGGNYNLNDVFEFKINPDQPWSGEQTGNTNRCVLNCKGLADGNYQSCNNCSYFIRCANEKVKGILPCPSGRKWDDFLKQCVVSSSTCPTGNPCLKSCHDVADGDYQSCMGCHYYATCYHGGIFDKRPCAASLVWDDRQKRCERSSPTCPGSEVKVDSDEVDLSIAEPDIKDTARNPRCISSGYPQLPNGKYQSCYGCHGYAEYRKPHFRAYIPCPRGKVWDDEVKECAYYSRTCPDMGLTCVWDCDGMKDGDYQSCFTCHGYVSCSGGIRYERPCATKELLWDDRIKQCNYTSPTCSGSSELREVEGTQPEPNPLPLEESQEEVQLVQDTEPVQVSGDYSERCVSNCKGLPDLNYQSCYGCGFYANCSHGRFRDFIPCPWGKTWDDTLKTCTGSHSTTCPYGNPCVRACGGLPDGDYQSCTGCHVYASCVAGKIYDRRPCPANLRWDDSVKRCESRSRTCFMEPEGKDPMDLLRELVSKVNPNSAEPRV